MSDRNETPPWDKDKPKTAAEPVKLTAADKKKAKARAEEAGRPYPNLVDNMQVTKEKKKRAKTER